MRRLAFAAAVLACATSASAAITPAEAARLRAGAAAVRDLEAMIPADYWNHAQCVVVIPEVKKAAFIFGGEYGRGMMSCRVGDRWSAPLFMQLAKGSWGFQVGAQQVDLVLLVMNESGVQKLLQNKMTLGIDAAVAAGPIGRQASAGTDVQLKAEILSYSRAAGLFAGVDLSGGVLRPDEDANQNAYGPSASPRTILASREISAPPEAAPFLEALAAGPSPTTARTTPPAPSGAPPAPAPAPTAASTNELRARIADMQRTIDELLSESRPVGTTGAAGQRAAGTITVERARLMQLRQQLDGLMSAINR